MNKTRKKKQVVLESTYKKQVFIYQDQYTWWVSRELAAGREWGIKEEEKLAGGGIDRRKTKRNDLKQQGQEGGIMWWRQKELKECLEPRENLAHLLKCYSGMYRAIAQQHSIHAACRKPQIQSLTAPVKTEKDSHLKPWRAAISQCRLGVGNGILVVC